MNLYKYAATLILQIGLYRTIDKNAQVPVGQALYMAATCWNHVARLGSLCASVVQRRIVSFRNRLNK